VKVFVGDREGQEDKISWSDCSAQRQERTSKDL
jgi:hypothetical protein